MSTQIKMRRYAKSSTNTRTEAVQVEGRSRSRRQSGSAVVEEPLVNTPAALTPPVLKKANAMRL
jgi:hypothetical protein